MIHYKKLSAQEILVSVIHKGVGQINESDIVLAEASDAIVIAFNVRPVAAGGKAGGECRDRNQDVFELSITPLRK